MIRRTAEGVLDQLEPLLENGDAESIAAVLGQVYEEFAGKYRPFLSAASKVSEQVSADLAPVLSTIIKVLNDTAKDEVLRAEVARYRKGRAEGRKNALDAYLVAGFSRAEAMNLILADIASMKETVRSASRQSSSSSK